MTSSNNPEKPFLESALSLAKEIADRQDDLKAVYDRAKDAEGVGKEGVKVIKRAVKLAMEDPRKRFTRHDLEDKAQHLAERLGVLAATPLGEAALREAAK